MTLFNLDDVEKRYKEKVTGSGKYNDYYPSLGSQYTGNSQTYQNYESAVNDAKKKLEEANKQAEYIDVIIDVLSRDVDYEEAALEEIRDQVVTFVDSFGLDQSNYDIKSLEITELENIKTDIKEKFAPTFDFYKALNEEQNAQTVSALVINKDNPEVISELIKTGASGPTGSIEEIDISPVNQKLVDRDVNRFQTSAGSVDRKAQEEKEMQEAVASVDFSGLTAADFGVAADMTDYTNQEALRESLGLPPKTETPSGPSGPSAADIIAQSQANRDEVYALLQEQFGGASYFFRKNAQNMQIGLTADGKLVSYNDPNATETTSLMDYIVENGITSVTRVKGLLQKTEWWQTTDRAMRAFDATWGDMSEPERTEFLEPLTDRLAKEAQFLGFELSDEEQFDLAKNLMRFGDSDDQEAIREAVLGQLQYGKMQSDISGFGAAKDAIQQLAYKYYTPIDDATAQDWAEQIYTGEATNEEYEQYLKATAVSRFPTLDKVINEMGVTPDQYFSPYKYQIEQMLGRQVNMLEEFSDVIEYMPDTGTASRPMTLSEVRKFVRATPEWQQTDDAKDQARALAFSIGQTFGEVA